MCVYCVCCPSVVNMMLCAALSSFATTRPTPLRRNLLGIRTQIPQSPHNQASCGSSCGSIKCFRILRLAVRRRRRPAAMRRAACALLGLLLQRAAAHALPREYEIARDLAILSDGRATSALSNEVGSS